MRLTPTKGNLPDVQDGCETRHSRRHSAPCPREASSGASSGPGGRTGPGRQLPRPPPEGSIAPSRALHRQPDGRADRLSTAVSLATASGPASSGAHPAARRSVTDGGCPRLSSRCLGPRRCRSGLSWPQPGPVTASLLSSWPRGPPFPKCLPCPPPALERERGPKAAIPAGEGPPAPRGRGGVRGGQKTTGVWDRSCSGPCPVGAPHRRCAVGSDDEL